MEPEKGGLTMIENYRQGYTKALIDVVHFFEFYIDSLSFYKMINKKRLPDILKLLLDNREEMMKWGGEIKVILKDRDDPKKKHLIVEKQ